MNFRSEGIGLPSTPSRRLAGLRDLATGGAAGAAAAAIVLTMIGDHAVTISRPTLEAAIEVLIDVLDEMDDDSDIEPDVGDEAEAIEEREPEEDFEASLGWSLTGAYGWRDVHPEFCDGEEDLAPVGRAA